MPIDPFDSDPAIVADLAALLGDASMWEAPDGGVEDAIVAAVASESTTVTPIGRARRRGLAILAGAAALVLVVAGVAAFRDGAVDQSVELALEPTELAPTASGSVVIDDTPLGTRLVLDVAGLAPSADGTYYEAWLRTGPDLGVSAGTFHLRGGDGEIELWAGVGLDEYPLFTITVQDEADPTSSGQVVLKGRVSE